MVVPSFRALFEKNSGELKGFFEQLEDFFHRSGRLFSKEDQLKNIENFSSP